MGSQGHIQDSDAFALHVSEVCGCIFSLGLFSLLHFKPPPLISISVLWTHIFFRVSSFFRLGLLCLIFLAAGPSSNPLLFFFYSPSIFYLLYFFYGSTLLQEEVPQFVVQEEDFVEDSMETVMDLLVDGTNIPTNQMFGEDPIQEDYGS